MMFHFTMYIFRKLYISFFILTLTIFLFSTTNLRAKSFEINDIEISEPFENDFNKNKVLDNGFKKAFFDLIRKLIKSKDVKRVDGIKLREIKSMVNSFTIKEEKFVDQTYFVNLGVSFNKRKIFNFFESKNIFPSQIIKENFLLIPIIIDEELNNLKIFSENNIYNDWNETKEKYHLINYVLPTEDLEDLNLIKKNYDLIEKYDFREIIKKYYLDNSIVILIFKDGNDVRILSKIITKDKVIIKNDSFPEFDLKDKKQISFLISNLKETYEDTWKENNQINTSIKLLLNIRADNQQSKKLLKFESALNDLDLVNYYSIKKFDNRHTFYEIIFNGTPKKFINLMKNKNYIFDTQKKTWILK